MNYRARGTASPLSGYSETEITEIAGLLKDGLSARQICERVGRSRNAIIGIVQRNEMLRQIGFERSNGRDGKTPVTKRSKSAPKSSPKRAPEPANTNTLAAPEPKAVTPKPLKIVPSPEPVLAPTCEPVRFADLERGQCSWCIEPTVSPAGPDMMCCSAPVIDRLAKEGRREATHCRYHFERGGA